MFDLENSINNWLKNFRRHKAFSDGSIREMELHLRDQIDDLIAMGYNEKEAFNKAVKEFGEVAPMAREEYSNLIPKSSYINIINIAMFKNYLKIVARNFLKRKFYSLINVLGLTIGLSVVFLISLFVADELSVDQFHEKKDQLYRVVENQYYAGQPVFPVAVTPAPLGPSLKEEYPEIINFTRVDYGNNIFVEGDQKIVERNGISVDVNFFEMFSFSLISGSLEAFDQNLNSIILNEELAKKYFPGKDPIGELINLDGEEYVITGIMEDVPKNTHLPFRYVKNFKKTVSENPDRTDSWGSNWLYTYVELDPKAELDPVNKKISGLIKANNEGSVTDIYLQPLTDIYLGDVDFAVEARNKGNMQYVRIFTIVAVFILLISCINFMNLSTARSAKRAKEVGLRKTVGASRKQLIFQFLGESMMMSVIAIILSIGVVVLLLPFFNQIAGKEFGIEMLFNAEKGITIISVILIAAIITGLVSGSYPAVFLSSINPVSSLKSEVNTGNRGSGFRKILVVFQFTISVVLIIGTLVVFNQLNFIQNKNLGYDRENIIILNPQDRSMIETFSNELREDPNIADAGASNRHPAYVYNSSSGFSWKGKDPESVVLFHLMGVDEHFMRTMRMELSEGRKFTYADSLGIIINEKAGSIMGLEQPVGEIITSGEDEYSIIGVVKDFHFKSIHNPIEPLIIYKTERLYRIFIRVKKNRTKEAIAGIEEKWTKFFPDDNFVYHFLDEDFENLYKAEQRTSTLSTYFAILAIFISCLGLFGLVSYASEQRTKEIGIRKVLGASSGRLFIMLTSDFMRLIIISLLIAIPVGWFAMNEWLEGFAYHIEITPWVFILSGVAAIIISLITLSYQSIRASISNPVKALHTE